MEDRIALFVNRENKRETTVVVHVDRRCSESAYRSSCTSSYLVTDLHGNRVLEGPPELMATTMYHVEGVPPYTFFTVDVVCTCEGVKALDRLGIYIDSESELRGFTL